MKSFLLTALIIGTFLTCGLRPLTPGERYNEELQSDLLNPPPPCPGPKPFTIIPPIDDPKSGGYPSYGTVYPNGTTVIINPDGDSTYIFPQGRE